MAPTKTQAINAAATLAVLAATFGTVSAAPFSVDGELIARGQGMSKVAGKAAKEVVGAAAQATGNKKLKEYTDQGTKVPPGLKDAAAKANKPHDPKLVAAATTLKPPKKKRDLSIDLLEERDLIDGLFARGQGMSRVAGKAAKEVVGAAAQVTGNKKLKEYTDQGTKVPQGLKDAAAKANKPHDPKLVAAATTPKPPKKKRGLSDIADLLEQREFDSEVEDLLARGLKSKISGKIGKVFGRPPNVQERDLDDLDELFTRGQGMSRVAGKAAKEVVGAAAQATGNKKLKEYTDQGTKVPQGLKDAAAKANKPHDPKLVAAATTPKPPKKKRDLSDIADLLEEREFDAEVEDLLARGLKSKISGKIGKVFGRPATASVQERNLDEPEDLFARGLKSKVAGNVGKAFGRPASVQERGVEDLISMLEARAMFDELEELD